VNERNPYGVTVGQVWADNDWRSRGRQVRVVEIRGIYAVVELVALAEHGFGELGRRTRVRLDRFRPTSTGYRLVHAAEEAGA
jgi:hypothetical protein